MPEATYTVDTLSTRDCVSGRRGKRACGARWIRRPPCRGWQSQRGKRGGRLALARRLPVPSAQGVYATGFALPNGCRAGFAGRGTTSALFIGPHARCPARPETKSRVARPGREDRGHRQPERACQGERRGHRRQRASVLHLVDVGAIETGAGGELDVGPAALGEQPDQGVARQRWHRGGSARRQIDSTVTSSAAATRCATERCGLL